METSKAVAGSGNTIQNNKGIAGSSLKLIAIITMLIDHVAAVVLERVIAVKRSGTANVLVNELFNMDAEELNRIYNFMRSIGRFAFPIFCFLLVEGFLHTRNTWKYALRLAVFALVSEIPFDLALFAKPLRFNYQNVFFTLLIGLLVLIGLKFVSEKTANKESNEILTVLANTAVVVAGIALAELLKTDYAGMGILTIVIMYVLRKSHFISMLGGCATLALLSYSELPALFVLIPAWFYNGKRGLNLKYIFYAFYPVHLFILYLICYYMHLV
jgi:hypothetical protein